jgi:hypothetical protein
MTRTLCCAAALVAALATSPAIADDGTADLARVPAGAALVMHLNVQGLMGTSLVSGLLKDAKANPKVTKDLAKLKKELGVDVERDVHGLTISLPVLGADAKQVLFQLDAKIDEKKLLASARKANKLTEEKYGGQVLYKGSDGNSMTMMGGRIVVGSHALVKKSVDAQKGKSPLSKDKKMMALVKATDTKKHLWMAVRVDDATRKQLGAQNPAMGKLESVTVSLGLAGGLQFDANLAGNDAKTTAASVDMLNKQIKMQLQNPMLAAMGVAPVFQKLKAAAKGKDAVLSLRLTDAEVARIKQTVSSMMKMGGGGRPMPAPGTKMKATPAKKAPAKKGK